jgi:thermostable 8-oxoguanine DNA glycosylase
MTLAEKEEFLIAAIAVAGKTAKTIFPKVHNFLYDTKWVGITPFETINNMYINNVLQYELEREKLGKYTLLTKSIEYLLSQKVDLSSDITIEDLEKVPGISLKTSRFFLLHTKKGLDIAVLDTHILKHLRYLGYSNIPDKTPGAKEYSRIEKYFLIEKEKNGMSSADFDLYLWNLYAK